MDAGTGAVGLLLTFAFGGNEVKQAHPFAFRRFGQAKALDA